MTWRSAHKSNSRQYWRMCCNLDRRFNVARDVQVADRACSRGVYAVCWTSLMPRFCSMLKEVHEEPRNTYHWASMKWKHHRSLSWKAWKLRRLAGIGYRKTSYFTSCNLTGLSLGRLSVLRVIMHSCASRTFRWRLSATERHIASLCLLLQGSTATSQGLLAGKMGGILPCARDDRGGPQVNCGTSCQ
jgi:hypothetical protein